MSRTRPILVSAVLALAVLAGSACSVTNPSALSVDGRTLSRSDLMAELKALSSNSDAMRAIFQVGPGATDGESPGTYSTGFTAEVLQRHVVADLLEQIASAEGLELTEARLDEARSLVARQIPESMGGFEDVIARIVALDEVLSPFLSAEELNALLVEAVGAATVTVDGQFGRWDAQRLRVVPPEGPLPPQASSPSIEELLARIAGGS